MKYLGLLIFVFVAGFAQGQPYKEAVKNENTKTSTKQATLKKEQFRQAFAHYLEQNLSAKLPGYALGTVIDGQLGFSKVAGEQTLGSGEKIDKDTIFRLASVSKTFTPAAVAAMDQQSLHFDSLISSYLPDLKLSKPEHKTDITVRHVLSHSTGLMPHAYTNLVQNNVPFQKIVKQLDKVDFVCAPGRCYGYQNVVYSLIGDVLANASKSTYEKIVDEKLFTPLAMDRSSFGLTAFLAENNRATPHRWDKQNRQWRATAPKENYYQLSPAAGVNTSLNDMMKWLKAQLGQYPDVLNKTQLDTMHRPHIKTSRKLAHYRRQAWDGVTDMHYALGWRTFNFNGEEGFVHHGGWVEGVRSEMVFNSRLNMGMVFLTNSEPGIASEIVPMFIQLYLQSYLDQPSE